MDPSYGLDVLDRGGLLLLTASNVVTILYSLSRLPLAATAVLIQ